jgi:hypothetical protein
MIDLELVMMRQETKAGTKQKLVISVRVDPSRLLDKFGGLFGRKPTADPDRPELPPPDPP